MIAFTYKKYCNCPHTQITMLLPMPFIGTSQNSVLGNLPTQQFFKVISVDFWLCFSTNTYLSISSNPLLWFYLQEYWSGNEALLTKKKKKRLMRSWDPSVAFSLCFFFLPETSGVHWVEKMIVWASSFYMCGYELSWTIYLILIL